MHFKNRKKAAALGGHEQGQKGGSERKSDQMVPGKGHCEKSGVCSENSGCQEGGNERQEDGVRTWGRGIPPTW